MALMGWLFKCYRKYICIRGAQIVVASAIKFCMVASNIFSIIITAFFIFYLFIFFFPLTKVCNSSHAPSRKCWLTCSQVIPELWVLWMELSHVTFFILTTLRWLLDVWKSYGPLVYAVRETMMMMRVRVMKLKTKWFCNEIPLCKVAEMCGF
jgi:hypothetical protein